MRRLIMKRMVTHGPSSMKVTSYGVMMAVNISANSMIRSHAPITLEWRGSIRNPGR